MAAKTRRVHIFRKFTFSRRKKKKKLQVGATTILVRNIQNILFPVPNMIYLVVLFWSKSQISPDLHGFYCITNVTHGIRI